MRKPLIVLLLAAAPGCASERVFYSGPLAGMQPRCPQAQGEMVMAAPRPFITNELAPISQADPGIEPQRPASVPKLSPPQSMPDTIIESEVEPNPPLPPAIQRESRRSL